MLKLIGKFLDYIETTDEDSLKILGLLVGALISLVSIIVGYIIGMIY